MLKATELIIPNLTRERRFKAPLERLPQNPPISYFEKPTLKSNPEVFLEQVLTKTSNEKLIKDAKLELEKLRTFVENDQTNINEIKKVSSSVDQGVAELNRIRNELASNITPTVLDINAKLETIPKGITLTQLAQAGAMSQSQRGSAYEELLSQRGSIASKQRSSASEASSVTSRGSGRSTGSSSSTSSGSGASVMSVDSEGYLKPKIDVSAIVAAGGGAAMPIKKLLKEQREQGLKTAITKAQLQREMSSVKKGDVKKVNEFVRRGQSIQEAIQEVLLQRESRIDLREQTRASEAKLTLDKFFSDV